MNRRGSVLDMFVSISLLFAAIIAIVVVYIAYDAFNDVVQENDAFGENGQAVMEEQYSRFDNVFDGVIVTLFFGMIIVTLIISWVIPSNPTFYFFMIVLLIILAVIGAYLSNAWGDATSGEDTFGLSSQNFPMSSFVFDNLFTIILISGVLVTIIFFAKPGSTL